MILAWLSPFYMFKNINNKRAYRSSSCGHWRENSSMSFNESDNRNEILLYIY